MAYILIQMPIHPSLYSVSFSIFLRLFYKISGEHPLRLPLQLGLSFCRLRCLITVFLFFSFFLSPSISPSLTRNAQFLCLCPVLYFGSDLLYLCWDVWLSFAADSLCCSSLIISLFSPIFLSFMLFITAGLWVVEVSGLIRYIDTVDITRCDLKGY